MDNIISINNTNYEVEKYLGKKGIYDTYVVNNKSDGTKSICKSRTHSSNNDIYEKQLYKYITQNHNVLKFINPLQSQIIDKSTNKTHSFYPIINGITINNLLPHLKKLTPKEQEILIGIIIKNLLEAVSNLHKIQILHNNLNPDNIVVELGSSPMSIKLINFDFSCGKFWSNNSYKYKKCNKTMKIYNGKGILNNNHNKIPSIIATELISRKKWDCWCCGLICLELLLGDIVPWDKIRMQPNNNSEMNKIYWKTIYENYVKTNKITRNYVKLILENLIEFPFVKHNNPAKYTVDKIIIMEKYI